MSNKVDFYRVMDLLDGNAYVVRPTCDITDEDCFVTLGTAALLPKEVAEDLCAALNLGRLSRNINRQYSDR